MTREEAPRASAPEAALKSAGRVQATVRVRPETRDALNAAAAESGLTVDGVVRRGLAAVRRVEWERRAAEEIAAWAADPEDRAELDRIDALLGDDE